VSVGIHLGPNFSGWMNLHSIGPVHLEAFFEVLFMFEAFLFIVKAFLLEAFLRFKAFRLEAFLTFETFLSSSRRSFLRHSSCLRPFFFSSSRRSLSHCIRLVVNNLYSSASHVLRKSLKSFLCSRSSFSSSRRSLLRCSSRLRRYFLS